MQELQPARTALVGVGFGREVAILPRPLIALDVSGAMLRESARRVPAPAAYIQADIRALPLATHAVDLLITCACLTHVSPDDVDGALAECRRVARRVILLEGDPVQQAHECDCGGWLSEATNTWAHVYLKRLCALGATIERSEWTQDGSDGTSWLAVQAA